MAALVCTRGRDCLQAVCLCLFRCRVHWTLLWQALRAERREVKAAYEKLTEVCVSVCMCQCV